VLVLVRTPKRGRKSRLIEHARANAREALGRHVAEAASQRTLLRGVAERFGLMAPPRRIEVYDNSHVSGTHAVGAMIVAGEEGFVKKAYRKFNIRSAELTPGDDYAMMREVLTRRFKRLQLETAKPADDIDSNAQEDLPSDTLADADDDFPSRPDLVLIDGGQGQLAIACAVLADLGLFDIPLVGVAKGPDRDAGHEHFHIKGRASFMLEPRDPVLYFLQRLRDEAHRFAIATHRAKRSKAIGINPLDEIAGIGPTRRRALLNHFGSAKAVSRAGAEDLLAVSGISAEMAQKIYDFFHDRAG
jgi:excinuclease ABC subunit C